MTAALERVLAVEDIYTAYGLSQVLFGVSIQVARGECVCLLGRNGVGKTALIMTLMGLTRRHGGARGICAGR